jgi:recombination protein RecT
MAEAAVQHVQPMPKNPIVVIHERLNSRVNELRMALPPNITPDHFIRVLMTAISTNPDLAACEWGSLWNATLRCAADGLLPDSTDAAFIPYKGKVTYIPMYKGLLKRFYNSGQFKEVTVGIVREGDTYRHYVDENGQHFLHEEADDTGDKPVRRAYATAITKDGGKFVASLTQAEINKRRNMSRAGREDAPWNSWREEMMKKTAIRVLAKLLPMSSDQGDDNLVPRITEAAIEAPQHGSERLSTQAALDHFGGATEQEPATASQRTPDATEAAGAADSNSERAESAAPPDDAETRKLRIAFLSGAEAHKKRAARKVPTDFTDHQQSWLDGYDSIG